MFRTSSLVSASFSKLASLSTRRGYKKTVEELAKQKPGCLKNANVLVRVDFNVPLSKSDASVITDDTRIREALPTINFLRNQGAKVILASHCGRPDGKVNEKMRMAPMAKRLSELINSPVNYVKDCVGADVETAIGNLSGGNVLMLENTRFYKEEEENDAEFAKKLSKNISVYVNDAFGTAHRAHASTQGVAKFANDKVSGFLMDKELTFLKSAVDNPKRPLAAIIGGAKISSKIKVIKSLLNKCDKIFIGGGMAFTFIAALNAKTGKSIVEKDFIPLAKSLLDDAKAKNVKIVLPVDFVVADEFKADSKPSVVDVIPDNAMGMDIGPETIKNFQQELKTCNTVVWNGPMGVFEFDNFAKGTFGVAKILADLTEQGCITIVGGGDSVAAVAKAKLESKMSHMSTGGGASLELLEGLELPGVAALDDK